jgi:hypothetical protein
MDRVMHKSFIIVSTYTVMHEVLTAALSSKPLSDTTEHDVDSRNIISIASKQQKNMLSPNCPHLSPKFYAK